MHAPYAPKPSAAVIAGVPLDRRGRYRAYLGARLLVAGTRMPLLDAARELMRIGTDPDAIVVMRHAGASHRALRGRLGSLAELTIDEDRCRFRRMRSGDTAPHAPNASGLYRGP